MGIQFKISNPFEISFQGASKGNAKNITREDARAFWGLEDANFYSNKQGCYIFAVRAAKGFTPWYVGKTKRNMIDECFQDSKLQKYNEVVFSITGTPVLFFVTRHDNRVNVPKNQLSELEIFLIQTAKLKNSYIKNVQHTKNIPTWGICGVIRAERGSSCATSDTFRKMMGL